MLQPHKFLRDLTSRPVSSNFSDVHKGRLMPVSIAGSSRLLLSSVTCWPLNPAEGHRIIASRRWLSLPAPLLSPGGYGQGSFASSWCSPSKHETKLLPIKTKRGLWGDLRQRLRFLPDNRTPWSRESTACQHSGTTKSPTADREGHDVSGGSAPDKPLNEVSKEPYVEGCSTDRLPPDASGIGEKNAKSGSDSSVSLWDLLVFLKEDKYRVWGFLLALLLSSGAQLLLPMAVGQLVDAVTQTAQQQQTQRRQHVEQCSLFDADTGRPSCRSEVCDGAPVANSSLSQAPTAATREAEIAPNQQLAAASSAVSASGASMPTGSAVDEKSPLFAIQGFLDTKLRTPGARVGLCVALGVVGAATSLMRLYLLESTVSQRMSAASEEM